MSDRKQKPPQLSDLLAARDGELDAAAMSNPGTAAGEAAAAQLERLNRIKAELNALPPVTPDAALWQAIEERAGRRRRSWLERFPLATAATVFLAAALTIVLWDPTRQDDPDAPGPQVNDPVAQLMLRSQRLESELLTRATAPAMTATSSEQALLYGIADVDAQLNELFETGAGSLAERERLWQERERLWRQRVMLLESLADVQRGQAVLRPAIY